MICNGKIVKKHTKYLRFLLWSKLKVSVRKFSRNLQTEHRSRARAPLT